MCNFLNSSKKCFALKREDFGDKADLFCLRARTFSFNKYISRVVKSNNAGSVHVPPKSPESLALRIRPQQGYQMLIAVTYRPERPVSAAAPLTAAIETKWESRSSSLLTMALQAAQLHP